MCVSFVAGFFVCCRCLLLLLFFIYALMSTSSVRLVFILTYLFLWATVICVFTQSLWWCRNGDLHLLPFFFTLPCRFLMQYMAANICFVVCYTKLVMQFTSLVFLIVNRRMCWISIVLNNESYQCINHAFIVLSNIVKFFFRALVCYNYNKPACPCKTFEMWIAHRHSLSNNEFCYETNVLLLKQKILLSEGTYL